MHPAIRATAPLLMALALAACGGGGGSPGATGSSGTTGSPGSSSGTGGTTNAEGAWLSFTPNPIEVSGYEGESVPFKITATSSRTFTKPFNVAIVDTSGTITTDVQISAQNEMTYVANLRTSAMLPAGTTQAKLEVRLCEDAPLTCAKPLPGSPWLVPLKVNVKSSAEAAKRIVLSAQSLQAEVYSGEKAMLSLDGTFTGDLLGQGFLVGIVDRGNLSTATVIPSSQGFRASLSTSASLQPGEYASNLEVRLCRDNPAVCSIPAPGSPVIVPLKISVKNSVNLTPLAAVPGLGSWSTYQGNAAHTGNADASFDVARFTRRFNIPATSTFVREFNTVAVDNGKVFVVTGGATSNPSELLAIREADGKVEWRGSLGNIERANSPAVGNGQVYVTSTGLDSFMWFFDQGGALLSKTTMVSQSFKYRAPTVLGDDLYSLDGLHNGITKFYAPAKTKTWSVYMPQADGYTVAVDAEFVYGYAGGTFSAMRVSDGVQTWAVGDADNPFPAFTGNTPALAGKLGIILEGGRLMAFDRTPTRTWSVANGFVGQPAVGNGLVYALAANGNVLEARTSADGKLQWTSESLGASDFREVIVTRNLAFVSGATRTLAIDLATHKIVWTYPRGGSLAISSNGVLYILGNTGALDAINLQ
jgi:hypothetical protein